MLRKSLIWMVALLGTSGATVLGQGVRFSLVAAGGGGMPVNGGNPWEIYWSSPAPLVAGSHWGVTPVPPALASMYQAPDDNLDALYSGSSITAPIQVVLYSLDETAPNVELYYTKAKGVQGKTHVTEFTLGLRGNSNMDGFDHHPPNLPNIPFAPGDYSVDVPDPPAGGGPPPGESEDIYSPIYALAVSGTLVLGVAGNDNVDGWRWVPGSPHPFKKICPLTNTTFWPTGALFSVDTGGSGLFDPGDIYWSPLTGAPPLVYMDDVVDLGLPDTADVDALDVLGTGRPPVWFPEPATVCLIGLGGVFLAVRRRRRRR
jgi:hypothetical protein